MKECLQEHTCDMHEEGERETKQESFFFKCLKKMKKEKNYDFHYYMLWFICGLSPKGLCAGGCVFNVVMER